MSGAGKVVVTQADRDAAAAYYYSAGGSPNVARTILAGEKDEWFRVQAFARFEAASTAEAVDMVREAVALCALVAKNTDWMPYPHCSEVDDAVRALSPKLADFLARHGGGDA
jgi:hypothetical protein